MTKEEEQYTVLYLLELINEVECPMLMYEHEKEVVKKALMEYEKMLSREEVTYYTILLFSGAVVVSIVLYAIDTAVNF